MYFVIFATDRPGTEALRAETRPSHRTYLRDESAHPGVVLHHGGPTLTDDGGKMNGSMLVIEAESLEVARTFSENDPYRKAGLFEEVHVRPWDWTAGRPD